MEHEHFENQEHEWESNLKVTEGVDGPVQVNPNALERMRRNHQQLMPLDWYVEGILKGDRVALSKAITLVESALPKHQDLAQQIIAACLPHAGKALRLGITGVPGAGKSTFIEALGVHLCDKGQKLAVLAIDPSSQRSKGSILGDKTRMESLSVHPNAYIRPSASAGTLGGVARKTRETIILCEAAGYDTIFVETVGVGQSETAVHSMVDFFLLILISGAGDELQGIKRGIMEMADGIDVNKAEEAMKSWAALILKVEGEGDIAFAKSYSAKNGKIRPDLQKDLEMISTHNIPRDIRYNQGLKALGLQ